MLAKYRSIACITLLFIYSQISIGKDVSVWVSSPVGHCYKSIDQFLVNTFGGNFNEDENIKTYAAEIGQKDVAITQYVWVEDITPGINTSRYLFAIDESKRACAILFVPASSSVQWATKYVKGMPEHVISIDTVPPGFAVTEIFQKINANTGVYSPKECFQVLVSGKKKRIPCRGVFAQ